MKREAEDIAHGVWRPIMRYRLLGVRRKDLSVSSQREEMMQWNKLNLQPMPTLEIMQPLPVAGKHATGFKRGRTCNRFQLRENMQTVPSTGKYAVGSKRRRTCNQFQARQKLRFPSAGERSQATL